MNQFNGSWCGVCGWKLYCVIQKQFSLDYILIMFFILLMCEYCWTSLMTNQHQSRQCFSTRHKTQHIRSDAHKKTHQCIMQSLFNIKCFHITATWHCSGVRLMGVISRCVWANLAICMLETVVSDFLDFAHSSCVAYTVHLYYCWQRYAILVFP